MKKDFLIRNYRLKSIVIIFSLLSISSCDRTFEPVYYVPDAIQPYIETFIEEGRLRGFEIEIDNLIVEYDSIPELPGCGKCNVVSKENNLQKILWLNTICEFTYAEQFETLVFHMLGHCILGREHNSEKLPNGAPRSLMAPSNFNLYSPCVYDIGGGPCDLRFRRSYYLDELFNEQTPVPDWGK